MADPRQSSSQGERSMYTSFTEARGTSNGMS
jgi:hypothetical protein